MARLPRSRSKPLSAALFPLGTGFAYFGAAAIALHLTRGADDIATLWPSSGILLAALLIARREHLGWHMAAAALASFCANLDAGNTVAAAGAFTLANIAESSIAAWLLRRRTGRRVSFTDSAGLTWFCLAAAGATATSATGAALLGPVPTLRFWFSWFATDLLGILVVTPLILIAAAIIRQGRATESSAGAAEIMGVFAGVACVAGLTFWQSDYPLLFLPMLAVLVAVARLGPLGAAGGVLIVAIEGALAISAGSGPFALVRAGSVSQGTFLQFYLLCLFAAALPLAALLAARVRLINQLAEKMRLLELAEGAANVGHWRLDAGTETITWSSEVFRIHGREGDVAPSLAAAIEAYHPEDRQRVSQCIEEALGNGRGFSFTARIVRPSGEIRQVLSRGEIDRKVGSGPPGLFGIIQDITAQVAHERALEGARAAAEEAARRAMIMAETDQLTGIANRRRTSVALDEAISASAGTGLPVAVAMFDIDHFKSINDTFGHQTGDQVLQRVARDAERELRSGDTLGRFGGEEFVIVLPHATARAAMRVAERIRTAIEAGGIDPRVTISIGVAQVEAGESAESVLRRVDQALYGAKAAGRNTLRLAA